MKSALTSPLFVTLACLILLSQVGAVGRHPALFALFYTLSFAGLAAYLFSCRNSRITSIWRLLAAALIARGCFWLFFPPGNDMNRYLWEGFIQLRGFSPYMLSPKSGALSHLVHGPMESIHPRINHPDMSGCYPPLSMLLFKLAAALSPTLFAMKSMLALFELGALACLLALVKKLRRPLFAVALYALNPLVLVYFTGEAHLDVIMVFFIALALLLFAHKKERWGFLALGLAVTAKYFAIALIPFFLTRRNIRGALWALAPLALFVPYLDAGASLFNSLGVFGMRMHYNDAVTALLRWSFLPEAVVPLVSALLLCAALTVVFVTVRNPFRSAFYAAGLTLLALPTLHPWYLGFVVLFLPLFPSSAWLVLCWSMVFTVPVLAVEFQTGVFQEIHWLKWFEYTPFFVLLGYALFRPVHIYQRHTFKPVSTIGVIIPTLNEAAGLKACLKSVVNAPHVHEIIIADGGSTDDTKRIARDFGAVVVDAPRGRGRQIRKGAQESSADVLLVLHGDCALTPGVSERILHSLNQNPAAAGGAVGMRFSPSSGLKSGLVEFLNGLRVRGTGISFGDQGQFARREALEGLGGFPDQYLMEDIELSLQLKEQGDLLYLGGGVEVSPRTWNTRAFGAHFVLIIRLFLTYLVKSRLKIGAPDAKEYYERYYGAS